MDSDTVSGRSEVIAELYQRRAARGYTAAALDHKTKNLLFLFGVAPMGMAGCLGDGDGSDTVLTLTSGFTTLNNEEDTGDEDPGDGDGDGDSTTAAEGEGDPETGDGDGDPTTGDGDGDPGDGDGDPETGDGDGDGDPTTGDGDGDPETGDGDGDGDDDSTTGGDGIEEACMAYGEQIGACYSPNYIDDAYMTCLAYYEMFQGMGPACASAFEELLVCLSGLPCEDFMTAFGCEQEVQAYMDNCGG